MDLIAFLKFFLCLIPVLAAGWVVFSFASRKEEGLEFTFLEKWALVFGIGWGGVTLEMFAFSLLRLPWTISFLCLPWIFLLPFSFGRSKRKERTPFA